MSRGVDESAVAGLTVLNAHGRACVHPAAAVEWLHDIEAELRETVLSNGAVLLRDLPIHDVPSFATLSSALVRQPFRPAEVFATRADLGSAVLSQMRWPAERELCSHQELSFASRFPGLLLLTCVRPATTGGETVLSDARRLTRHLPPALLDRMWSGGWQMVRTFRDGFGMSWQEAFGVSDTAALAAALNAADVSHEWLPDDSLRTLRQRPALIRHPVTGAICWFNQAGFLNEGSMDARERDVLRAAFGADLPVNTFHGDGTPLAAEELLAIERAYDSTAVMVSWRPGDLLILDNVLTAHGRRPYTGTRQVLLTRAEPVRLRDCPPARPTAAPSTEATGRDPVHHPRGATDHG